MTRLSRIFLSVFVAAALACCAVAIHAQPLDLSYPAAPPSEVGPGPVYYYDSMVLPPDGSVSTYFYFWELDNYSTDLSIVSWVWAGGNVFDLGEPTQEFFVPGPLPFAPANSVDDHSFGITGIGESTSAPMEVESVITFSNGYEAVHNIYVPEAAVPEPASLLALAGGLGSLGLILRRR